jgi:hypothetical protein
VPVTEYTYVKSNVLVGQLVDEINDSSITIALDHINTKDDALSIFFKVAISAGEETTLDALVAAHVRDPNAEPPVFVTATLDANENIVANKTSPVTSDGEMHTIQSNMANVTGNKLVNWSMHYTLGADTSIEERFVVPSGQTASIEFVQGYSSAVPFSVELNWYKDAGKRTNPAINPVDYAIQEVNGFHAAGSTVITLKGGGHGFAFNALEVNKRYAFGSASGTFVRKVTSKSGPSKTVTLTVGTPYDLADGDPFALIDRPIARLGGDAANALMDFEVAPSFRGNDTRYLELVIKNESLTDSGDVFALVNGWTTATNGGTIPGQGGDSGVDEDA